MRDTPNVDAILAIDNNAYKCNFQNRIENKIFYGISVKCFFFDSNLHDELELPYFSHTSKKNFSDVMWYNGDYRFYYVRKYFPNYDYYWQFDYDVFCNAPTYEGFLKKFADDRSDLLIEKLSLGQEANESRWDYKLDWVYKNHAIYSGFYPAVRLSARAIDFLYRRRLAHKEIFNPENWEGDWAFCEIFTPTELMNNGFSCANLNEPNIHFENIYFNDDRVFLKPNNKLYHPLKSTIEEISKLKVSLRELFLEKIISLSFGINIGDFKKCQIHFNEDFTFSAIPIIIGSQGGGGEAFYTIQFLSRWIIIGFNCQGRFANIDIRHLKDKRALKNFGFLKNNNRTSVVAQLPQNFNDVAQIVTAMKNLIESTFPIVEKILLSGGMKYEKIIDRNFIVDTDII